MQRNQHSASMPRGHGEMPWRPGRTVLVVEDDPALLAVLESLLLDSGFRVLTAVNGRDALERYRSEGADLILTDFLMPEMNGSELLRTLGAGQPGRPPVVLMSSMDEHVVAHACHGYARFFRKPFDVEQFLEALEALTAPTPGRGLRLVR